MKEMGKLLDFISRVVYFMTNIIAAAVSYHFNASIGWAIFHFIFGPLYLIYCFVLGIFSDGKLIEILSSLV